MLSITQPPISTILKIVHPVCTNFPVALLLTAIILECASRWILTERLRITGRVVFFIAVIWSFVTYASGYGSTYALSAQEYAKHQVAISEHQQTAKLLLFMLVPTAILALGKVEVPGKQRFLYLCALWLSVACVCHTAHLGGLMVHQQGVGVASEQRQLSQGLLNSAKVEKE